MKDNSQINGAFIYVSLSVTTHISKSKFIGGTAITGGAIFINGLSNLYFSGCIFTDN